MKKIAKRISFDFDGTLTELNVQRFCYSLLKQGCEVWITTLRCSPEEMRKRPEKRFFYDNKDLYKLAEDLGILPQHIQFCNETSYKVPQLIDKDFAFHLDDDPFIVSEIGKHLPHIIVDYNHANWRTHCLERLL